MQTRHPKRNLSGGMINREMWYSSDLVPVRNGAAKIQNFIVRIQGGVERRPGTEFIAKAKAVSPVWLSVFAPSRTQGHLVELTDMAARIRATDSPVTYHEIVTPYGAELLPYLQFAQSNEVQWIFSGTAIKELQRTEVSLGVYTFALVAAGVKNGPFLDQNTDETLTITASSEAGAAIALNASADLFDAGHVGAYFKLSEQDFSDTPKWEVEEPVILGARVRYNRNVYEVTTAGTTSSSPPGHLEGIETDGTSATAVSFKYLHSGFGIVLVTGITSATIATAEVIKRLPEQTLGGVSKWSEGAWSEVRGFPITGAIYKEALWAGGSNHQPFMIWKSAIQGFDDFEPGTNDDSSLSRPLLDGKSEPVRWMVASHVLAMGTDGPEWIARPDTTGDTVRVNNLITDIATNQGSAEIPGYEVNGTTVFVGASLTQLLGMGYDFRKNQWLDKDYSLFGSDVLGAGIVQLVYQRRPWPLFWCLLADGKVASLTFQPAQEVNAWHIHDFCGFVESIAVAPVAGGARETLFLAVRRTINGSEETHIERMFDRFRPERGQTIADARYLCAAVTYDLAEAATVFSGLDHLEGQQVVALVDGYSHPAVTVVGGQVTLSFAGSNVVIGLAYSSRLGTLPFDTGAPDDFQAGRKTTTRELYIAFKDTLGGQLTINGVSEQVFPLGATDLDTPLDLFSGVKEIAPPSSEGGQMEYSNDTPWPAHVVGIFPQFEV